MLAERTVSQQGNRKPQLNYSCFNQTVSGRGWPGERVSIHTTIKTEAGAAPHVRGSSVKSTDYNQELMILKEIQKEMANAKVAIPSVRQHPSFKNGQESSNSLKEVRKHQQQQIKEMVSAKSIKKQPFSQVSLALAKVVPAQPYRVSVPRVKPKAEPDRQPQNASYNPLETKNWGGPPGSSKTHEWHSMIQKIKSAAAKYKKMTKNSAFLIHRVHIDEKARGSTRPKSRKWVGQVTFTTSKPMERPVRGGSRRPERTTSVEESRGREGYGPDPWNIEESHVFESEEMGVEA